MMQGGTSAVSQVATERGGIIGTGSEEVGYNMLNASSVLCTLLAANGHAPLLEEQESAPPIDPILHRVMTDDELRVIDPLLHEFTAANRKLMSVYGNTVHANDGSHLHGGIDPAKDKQMQRLHHQVASMKQFLLCDLPSGRWANRVLDLQTQLWKDVKERCCNSEKALLLAPCILRKTRVAENFAETKILLWMRMDVWEAGRFWALVKDVEECGMEDGWGLSHNSDFDLESAG